MQALAEGLAKGISTSLVRNVAPACGISLAEVADWLHARADSDNVSLIGQMQILTALHRASDSTVSSSCKNIMTYACH